MEIPIKTVKARRLSEELADQLKSLIYRGILRPGDRLMSERELAQRFGVSRPVIREALNKLSVAGVVESKRGKGTFVKSPEAHEANPFAVFLEGEDINILHVLEVRLGLECNAAAFAAIRANEEDIRFMKKSLEAMWDDIQKGGLGHENDISFHMAVAYATKNPLQIRIMKYLYDLLFHSIRFNLEQLYKDKNNTEVIMRHHTNIYEAIKSRDTERALSSMREHIEYVLYFFRDTGRNGFRPRFQGS